MSGPQPNISELRDVLHYLMVKGKAGTVPMQLISELTNCAGKILKSVVVELEYRKMTKNKGEIPYLVYSESAARQE